MEEWLDVEQAAQTLGVGRETVRRLLREGKLPGIYYGTQAGWRIRRAALDEWIATREGVAPRRTEEE